MSHNLPHPPLPTPPPASIPILSSSSLDATTLQNPHLTEQFLRTSQQFDELMQEIQAIDARGLNVDALSSLPAHLISSQLSTLERHALTLGFEEASAMQTGRELNIFSAPPAHSALAEILQYAADAAAVPAAAAAATSSLQADSSQQHHQQLAAQYQHLKQLLDARDGEGKNASLLDALQQQIQSGSGGTGVDCYCGCATQLSEKF